MPSHQTLENFIAMVESGAHAEAIEAFYTEQASMRENLQAPRTGRANLAANERQVLSRGTCTVSKCIRPVFVQGNQVVIRWFFRFEWHNGTVTDIEELAHQRWAGEQIAEEQFFYDPVQLKPR